MMDNSQCELNVKKEFWHVEVSECTNKLIYLYKQFVKFYLFQFGKLESEFTIRLSIYFILFIGSKSEILLPNT